MANPEMSRNTDVSATIAGFYFQIAIACKEICKNDVKAVGVETGADVVIIDRDGKKLILKRNYILINLDVFQMIL